MLNNSKNQTYDKSYSMKTKFIFWWN